jgi:hypothetical protein
MSSKHETDRVKVLFWHEGESGGEVESAWAEKVNSYYRPDNILFYAKEYALGDLFEATMVDGELLAGDLIEESGHSNIRILVSDTSLAAGLRAELRAKGCTSELSNIPKLFSVDVPKEKEYSGIKEWLEGLSEKGVIEYEEGCLSMHHRKQMTSES